MARTPRKWTGARTPSGLQRVRNAERRHAVLGPRRAAAKTLVKNAIAVAGADTDAESPQIALAEAMSALDRAAKVGAIHPNAAARRKSRLALRMNALMGGAVGAGAGRTKQVGKAQAQKAAKARIAAGKAGKAKGAQTAAGKARAALTRGSRSEATEAGAPTTAVTSAPGAKAAPKAKASTKPAKAAPKAKASAAKTGAAARAKAAAKPAVKPAVKPAAKKAQKS